MTVPKTTVDENDGGIFGEDDIGTAGKVFSMKPKAKSHSMKQRPNPHLRAGIFRPHPAHDFAAFFCGNGIHGHCTGHFLKITVQPFGFAGKT
jgi:hypothetical protein